MEDRTLKKKRSKKPANVGGRPALEEPKDKRIVAFATAAERDKIDAVIELMGVKSASELSMSLLRRYCDLFLEAHANGETQRDVFGNYSMKAAWLPESSSS